MNVRAKYLALVLCWFVLMLFGSPEVGGWLEEAWAGPGQCPGRQSIPTLTPTPGPTAIPSPGGDDGTAPPPPPAAAGTPDLPAAPTLLALTRSPGAVATATRRALETAEGLVGQGGQDGQDGRDGSGGGWAATPTPFWLVATSGGTPTPAATPVTAPPLTPLPVSACINLVVCGVGAALVLIGVELVRRR